MATLSRQDGIDLALLSLSPPPPDCELEPGLLPCGLSVTRVKRGYHKKALLAHPRSTGGSKHVFQALGAAYDRLLANAPEDDDAAGAGYDFSDFYDFYDAYDRNGLGADEAAGFARFDTWTRYSSSERATWRSRNVPPPERAAEDEAASTKCTCCNEREAISEDAAISSGLNWEQYLESGPERNYRTCWACKNAHDSVLTESQACSKYPPLALKQTGEYLLGNNFFGSLRKAGKSFEHKPHELVRGAARNSHNYWAQDLEPEARARGWLSKREKALEREKSRIAREHKKEKKRLREEQRMARASYGDDSDSEDTDNYSPHMRTSAYSNSRTSTVQPGKMRWKRGLYSATPTSTYTSPPSPKSDEYEPEEREYAAADGISTQGGKRVRREPAVCKCGSRSHKRSSHASCPFNPKNMRS